MKPWFMPLDLWEIDRIQGILAKLADEAPENAFTEEERAIMRRLREHREVVLAELYAIAKDAIPQNRRGREKILSLIRGVEKICG